MTTNLLSSLYGIAPALRWRNFRLFWLAQLLSTTGTSLQVVAEGWLIYQLTESTFWLGAVGFMALIPVLPISLLGGVLIDRVPRRKLILLTQVGLLLQAGLFGLLGVTGQLQLWHIIALYFVFGALLAIDHPARRAFLVDLVPERDLANAVALNAALFNVANLIGYAISGFLIAAIGAGGTMLLNSLTYLGPIGAMLLINVPDVRHDQAQSKVGRAISEGFKVLWQQPAVLAVISLMAVVGGLAYPVIGLMPAIAKEILHTDAIGLGLLLAAGALGSVIGTVVTARIGGGRRGAALLVAGLILPILVMGVAVSQSLWWALAAMVAVGIALLMVQSLAITLVQVYIPDRVRGRVMSLYSILHAGADTGSNMIVGAAAVYTGLPLALGLGALLALAYAIGLGILMPALRKLD